MMNLSKINRLIASAILCLGFFAFCTVGQAQPPPIVPTWTGNTPCYTLTQTTTASCNLNCQGGTCNGGACNHCVTFTMQNISSCWITELSIGAPTGVCFSICCPPALGSPVETNCDAVTYTGPPGQTGNIKHFAGGTGLAPNGGAGSTGTFSICYCGSGPQSFVIFDESTVDACCVFVPGPPPSNFFTVTF
jgi:hypothetical protein